VSNRLYILLDAFLIRVFLLSGVVFAYPYCCCGGPLLGIGLAVACDCVPLLFYLCLPYDICISGDY